MASSASFVYIDDIDGGLETHDESEFDNDEEEIPRNFAHEAVNMEQQEALEKIEDQVTRKIVQEFLCLTGKRVCIPNCLSPIKPKTN
jgi:hypothetical protein